SARFVTGRLDPLASRDAFLDLARRAAVPILLGYGAETPPRARAGMEGAAAGGGLRTAPPPPGQPPVHGEVPDATFNAIGPFLGEEPHSTATPQSRFSV